MKHKKFFRKSIFFSSNHQGFNKNENGLYFMKKKKNGFSIDTDVFVLIWYLTKRFKTTQTLINFNRTCLSLSYCFAMYAVHIVISLNQFVDKGLEMEPETKSNSHLFMLFISHSIHFSLTCFMFLYFLFHFHSGYYVCIVKPFSGNL